MKALTLLLLSGSTLLAIEPAMKCDALAAKSFGDKTTFARCDRSKASLVQSREALSAASSIRACGIEEKDQRVRVVRVRRAGYPNALSVLLKTSCSPAAPRSDVTPGIRTDNTTWKCCISAFGRLTR